MSENLNPKKNSIKRLWKEMGRHKKLYLFGLFLGIIDASCQSVLPLFFRNIINNLETGISNYTNDILIPISITALIVLVIFFPAAYFFHYLTSKSISIVMRDIRVKLYAHVQSLSADFFQKTKVGEITSRMNDDLNTLEFGLFSVMGLISASFVLLQSLVFIYLINWKLSILLTFFLVSTFIGSKYFLPKIKKLTRSVRDASGEASATLTEYISVNSLLKTLAREDYGTQQVERASNHLLHQNLHRLKFQLLFTDSLQVYVRFFSPIIILLVGGFMVFKKQILLGDLVAFWGFWLILNGLLSGIVSCMTVIFSSLASADRVFEYFDTTPSVKDKPNAINLQNIKGSIEFKDVSFNYPTDTEITVLNNINFIIHPGQQIAFVGPSGAGKSTILQLIQRFYDTKNGSIKIDGHNITDISQKSLRSQIGFVMQESIFFSGSIYENLKLGKLDATESEMINALENANASNFVEELTNGIHTVIGERGARLSGGQKQRLAIARVFLKNPPILLFDEATSALDSLSEKAVQDALQKLMSGRTTFTVAHRISTIKSANCIMVVEKGEIIAQGTHDELIRRNPLYNQLATHQNLSNAS